MKGERFKIEGDNVFAKRRGHQNDILPLGEYEVEAVSVCDGVVEVHRDNDRDFYEVGVFEILRAFIDGRAKPTTKGTKP